ATDLTVTTVTSSATINSSGTVTISDGAFSGNLVTGALTKVTAGTLTLSGSNATPGPITVNGGTLVLANATDTLASNADLIANSGTVIDIQGNTDTIGTLTVNDADLNGTGRLTATTYALNDGAIVRANLGDGTATVNGEVRALSTLGVGALDLTIANGGVLRGLAEDELPGGNRSFTIDGDLTTDDGGRLAPGASPGTTIVTGDWTQNGTFETELAGLAGAGVAGGHDQIQVGGVITLGATSVLDIRRDGTFTEPVRGDLFRIIVGDLTNQSFATVGTQFSTGLVLDLVDGTLIGTGLPVLNSAGQVDLRDIPGLDANTIAIVGAFQAQAFSADANGVQMNSANDPLIGTPAAQGIRALLTTPIGAGNGIQAASPESFAGESAYAVRATRHYADTALNSPALALAGDVSLFAAYSGHSAETDSSIAAGDYELTGSGALAGVRMPVGDSPVVVGLYAAFDEGDIRSMHRDAEVSGLTLGLIGEAAVGERTAVTASIAHGEYESDSLRNSLFGGRARARDIDSDVLHLSVGLRHDWIKEKNRGFSPYVEFRYTDASTEAFGEAGTFDRLNVEAIDYTSLEGELGARGYIMVTEKFAFNGQLGVAQDFGDDDTDVAARLAAGGQRFVVNSEGFGATTVSAGLGVSYDVTDRLRLGAGVKAGLVTDADTALNYHVGGSFRF
ncbi:MAG: autotransporter domain-containing protein, partial [Opitutaceae bacterium]|nr:autotransporter domain-containing protein [Opitutaceae bacterium]